MPIGLLFMSDDLIGVHYFFFSLVFACMFICVRMYAHIRMCKTRLMSISCATGINYRFVYKSDVCVCAPCDRSIIFIAYIAV